MTTAVIGGAASGIGRAIAMELASRGGLNLELLDIDESGLEALASQIGDSCGYVPTDLSSAASVSAALQTIGARNESIDYLFNCAGIPAGTPAWPDTPADRIQLIIQLNLLGTIFSVQAALPYMRNPGGSIVNIGSTSGLNPYLTGAVYAASKAGVIMFTRSCADLTDKVGVRVNALCPGIVNTPFLQKTGAGGQTADWLRGRVAGGDILSAEQVAHAAIKLAEQTELSGHYEVLLPSGQTIA